MHNGATLALSVGGTGWAAADVGVLLANNGASFNPGSVLGIDTTNANFSYGTISGSMGLTKLGVNTLTLTGANTYMGPTVVNGGMLAVTYTGALPGYTTPSMLTINSGATLALSVGGTGWAATDVSTLLANNGAGFNPGSTLGIDTTLAGTGGFTCGPISGSMGLTKLAPTR